MEWIEVCNVLGTATPASPLTLSSIDKPGVYAWWDPKGALARFWPTGFPQVDPAKPLYVGIARTTLAERAGKMHLEKTRISTIRRSLVALLVDDLLVLPEIVVDPRRRTKFSLAPAAEQLLTNWMITHLQTTWVLHPTPEDVEKDIIKKIAPPLNYAHATKGPYAKPLQAHRDQLLTRVAPYQPSSLSINTHALNRAGNHAVL
ncbi:GIY-YIG nuclease family protein [Paeniglutamicibacter sp. ORCA_105]|uniref:GIY-YIG nuclease family protein n=1 Tax=Paeniglutamicibacter sp. ORCA_105 TaxID=3377336 RepID=UPI003893779B